MTETVDYFHSLPPFHKLSQEGGWCTINLVKCKKRFFVVSIPRDRNGRSMFNRTWLNLPSLPLFFSLSFSSGEGEKRDGSIRVPLAAARSMGCRCENSISFRLSRAAATIFVFGVRARALPLNVPREEEENAEVSSVPYASPRDPSYSRGETRLKNLSNVPEINDEFTRRERVNLEIYSFLEEKSDM